MIRRVSFTASLYAAAVVLALAVPAYAAGGGNAGGSGGFSGNSAGHISSQGVANSNGPNSLDRDFGQARASDRNGIHGNGPKTAPTTKTK